MHRPSNRRRARRPTASPWVGAALLAWLALVGCGLSSGDLPQATGDPDKGTTLTPRTVGGGEPFTEAYELAGVAGRQLLHAEGIAWTGLTGASNEAAHRDLLQIAEQADRRGFELTVALLPVTGPDRSEIALPASFSGARSFADGRVRRAFLDEVVWIAERIRPEHLSLATEVGGYFLANPVDFDALASLCREAYRAVKRVSPGTQVFVYFQYESLFRDFPGGDAAVADNLDDLVRRFEPELDYVGLSSYPALLARFASPADLPDDYYARLAPVLRHPLFFAELGYPSRPSLIYAPTSEDRQAEFVSRFFQLTAGLDVEVQVWSFLHDPEVFFPGIGGEITASFFRSHGLRRSDGTPKPAWQRWLDS